MANSSTDSIGSFSAEKLDQKTKDIFNGKALIDRLLVYFSKFEGSRDKAKRYAQKLLDLGHIESLSQTLTFEDSAEEYRWTDVASVVNKAKAKVAAQDGANTANGSVIASENKTVKSRRPTLRISIEADNCDGAEIQAHIRTNPTTWSNETCSSTKTGDTICLAEVQNGKMISFVTETSKTEEILRMVPVSTVIHGKDQLQNHNSRKIMSKDCHLHDKTQQRKHAGMKHNPEIKESPYNSSEADSAIEADNSSTIEQAATIDNSSTPGQGVTSSSANTFLERSAEKDFEHSQKIKKSKSDVKRNVINETAEKAKPNLHKYKWETSQIQTTNVTNKEKVIDESAGRNVTIPSQSTPYPRGRNETKGDDRRSLSSVSSLSDSEKSFVTPDNSPPVQARKLKFKNDTDWIKLRREYLEHEEIREMIEQRNGQTTVYNDTGMSLHAVNEEEEVENITEFVEVEDNILTVPVQPPIPISPPLSTPTSPRKSPTDLGIKSLFWTKIVCDSSSSDEAEGIFWLNVDKKLQLDENEISRLFSKPAPSSIQKTSRNKMNQQQEKEIADGKALKVLATERSRQVGIRASSIRLPIEDIHDAVLNMDDSVLDIDALEALYDVRPTSEELDDFSDALKRFPNGVLDKPEQFVLMLAMLGNLDERLKSWIFAKKFPDKVLDIKDHLNALSNACIQIVRNPTLQMLLEATLLLGNFMNKGTQRGDADGYLLDILPKLKDVKSQGGETNLLLYLVKWMISEREKSNPDLTNDIKRQNTTTSTITDDGEEDDCRLPVQNILQKACSVNLQDVMEEIENLSTELTECKDQLIPAVIEGATCIAEIKPFNSRMTSFMEQAEKALIELQTLAAETADIADEFKHYYVPSENAKTESISNMLKHINSFCEDFRMYWNEEKRNAAKEVFFNTEKARRQRIAAIKVAKSPSALKARFLEKRKRDGAMNEKEESKNGSLKSGENNAQRPPGRRELRTEANSQQRQLTPSRRPMGLKHPSVEITQELSLQNSTLSQSMGGRKLVGVPNSNYHDSMTSLRGQKPIEKSSFSNGHVPRESGYKSTTPTTSAIRPARNNANKNSQQNVPVAMSRMKQAMTKRRMLLKSKTC